MITIVSGLPRSGTSMMMQMLAGGGLSLLTDNERQADGDNPHGYMEFERVKQTKQDASWLNEADGKVVKMISMLLYDLPVGRTYKIVFMRREMDEVLASQTQMLKNLGKSTGPSDAEMRSFFQAHLDKLLQWFATARHLDVLQVPYRDVLSNPRPQAKVIAAFLGGQIDVEGMVRAVDPALYRNRTSGPNV